MANLKIFWLVAMKGYLFVTACGLIAMMAFANFSWQDYLILTNGASVGIAILYIIFCLKGEFND